MPFESHMIHVRWSGEGVWLPLGDLNFGVGYENHTKLSGAGPDHPLSRRHRRRPEILLACMAACISPAKMGQLAGNHFITLTSGLERLPELGKTVLWKGAQKVRLPKWCECVVRVAFA